MMKQERIGGRVDEYLTLTQAAQILGVSRWTLYRRIDEGALTVYESPSNRRVKLVRRPDVERLMKPVLSATPVTGKGNQRNA
jgi:excisionase family DNA binding protein